MSKWSNDPAPSLTKGGRASGVPHTVCTKHCGTAAKRDNQP